MPGIELPSDRFIAPVRLGKTRPRRFLRATQGEPILFTSSAIDAYSRAAILDPGVVGANIVAREDGHDEARERSFAAGFDKHITKPVDRHALQALFQRLR